MSVVSKVTYNEKSLFFPENEFDAYEVGADIPHYSVGEKSVGEKTSHVVLPVIPDGAQPPPPYNEKLDRCVQGESSPVRIWKQLKFTLGDIGEHKQNWSEWVGEKALIGLAVPVGVAVLGIGKAASYRPVVVGFATLALLAALALFLGNIVAPVATTALVTAIAVKCVLGLGCYTGAAIALLGLRAAGRYGNEELYQTFRNGVV